MKKQGLIFISIVCLITILLFIKVQAKELIKVLKSCPSGQIEKVDARGNRYCQRLPGTAPYPGGGGNVIDCGGLTQADCNYKPKPKPKPGKPSNPGTNPPQDNTPPVKTCTPSTCWDHWTETKYRCSRGRSSYAPSGGFVDGGRYMCSERSSSSSSYDFGSCVYCHYRVVYR